MLELINEEKYIIIADYEYFPLLFQFKNNHHNLNLKIITKSEACDRLSISFSSDPIPFLIKEGYHYDNAKKIINLLRYSDISKSEKLNTIYQSLNNNGYILKDEFGCIEFSNTHILLFEANEDKELQFLFERNNLSYQLINFSDLDIKASDTYNHLEVCHFKNKFAQYFYIFSDIRKRILLNHEIKDNIKILIQDENDLFYLKLCSSAFKIPVTIHLQKSLVSDIQIKNKESEIFASKSLYFSQNDLKIESLNLLNDLIEKYHLRELSDFDYIYSNLLEIISSYKYKLNIGDSGIKVVTDFVINPSDIVYVTNFQHDIFYKVFEDNNFLSDSELTKTSANASYIKTSLDRRLKLNYITYSNIVLLSRVEQHLKDKIYESQFIEEIFGNCVIKKKDLNDSTGYFTSEALNLVNCDDLDKHFYQGKLDPFYTYDHAFKGLDNDNGIFTNKKGWSVTNLESYINCPFKYYLSKIIPPTSDDYHARCRGTLIHKVYENINQEDYDFDSIFNEAKQEYIMQYNEHDTYGEKEEVWIDIIYYWLKQFVSIYRDVVYTHAKVVPHQNDAEQEVNYSLCDENDNRYYLRGFIDKIVWTEYNNRKFYTIVDYKSGSEDFDIRSVFLGKSTQLPLYYYAINQQNDDRKDELVGDYEFGGFGIQHTYFSSLKNAIANNDEHVNSMDNLIKSMKIGGSAFLDEDYWHSIDNESFNKKGEISKHGGIILNYKNVFTSTDDEANDVLVSGAKFSLERYNLYDLIEDAKKATTQTIKDIQQLKFDIKPTSLKISAFNPTTLMCRYCQYSNICYVKRATDAENYNPLIIKHFNPPKKKIIVKENEGNKE